MPTAYSPLRYPGGKQVLSHLLAHLIRTNDGQEGVYAEPYAGGAGAALSLLIGEHVSRIMINDADPSVAAFWRAVLSQTNAFIDLIKSTPLTVREWRKQREIYQTRRRSCLKVGFATFYLNRCNRSGIIASGGPIGGIKQTGEWKIDARFNREELARRIQRIAMFRDRIQLFNLDAIDFLKKHVTQRRRTAKPVFAYLDPPYFVKGGALYLNYYESADHATLATYLKSAVRFNWVLSYDNAPEIRELYKPLRTIRFDLDYSARERSKGKEVLIVKDGLKVPDKWKARIPATAFGARARFD